MKIATAMIGTLWARLLALVVFLSPVILSSVLAGPYAAQRAYKAPGTGQGPPPSRRTETFVWSGNTDQHAGLYLYRLTMEVRFCRIYIAGNQYRSGLSVRAHFQRKVFGQWKDYTPSSITATGNATPTRAPVSSSGGSGFLQPSSFSGVSMGSGMYLDHIIDVSGPGFGVPHGSYSVTALAANGDPVTASVSW